MPLEIFYFRNEHGRSAVQDFLKALDPKAFARSLAQIDLLESGEPLPAKLDQLARVVHSGSTIDAKPDEQNSDSAQLIPSEQTLRYLTSRTGHDRVRYYYVPASGSRVVIVDVVEGKKPRKSHLAKLAESIAQAGALEQPSSFKSHREYVAESTLGDSDLAARYARARERAQFALALIRLREAASYTPESLAERTGISRERILRIERGQVPKLAALRRLVDALNAQIIISPGSGLSVEPVQPEIAPADQPPAKLVPEAKPKAAKPDARAAMPKHLPASKTAQPKPNVKTRTAAVKPIPASTGTAIVSKTRKAAAPRSGSKTINNTDSAAGTEIDPANPASATESINKPSS